jgi:hypothetical protein
MKSEVKEDKSVQLSIRTNQRVLQRLDDVARVMFLSGRCGRSDAARAVLARGLRILEMEMLNRRGGEGL